MTSLNAILFGEGELYRAEALAKRRTVVRYLVAFLDRHLKGREVALLEEEQDGDAARLSVYGAPADADEERSPTLEQWTAENMKP